MAGEEQVQEQGFSAQLDAAGDSAIERLGAKPAPTPEPAAEPQAEPAAPEGAPAAPEAEPQEPEAAWEGEVDGQPIRLGREELDFLVKFGAAAWRRAQAARQQPQPEPEPAAQPAPQPEGKDEEIPPEVQKLLDKYSKPIRDQLEALIKERSEERQRVEQEQRESRAREALREAQAAVSKIEALKGLPPERQQFWVGAILVHMAHNPRATWDEAAKRVSENIAPIVDAAKQSYLTGKARQQPVDAGAGGAPAPGGQKKPTGMDLFNGKTEQAALARLAASVAEGT